MDPLTTNSAIYHDLLTLRVSSLLSSLNDASVDITDDEGSFEFSLKVKFISPLYAHVTLPTDIEGESPHFSHFVQC